MDAFPLATELLKAFPVGTLGLLVAVASTVAAEHGPDNARRLCAELAANDELWAFIASRVGGAPLDQHSSPSADGAQADRAGTPVNIDLSDISPQHSTTGPP